MEKDDLKLLWKELHSDTPTVNETEIKKSINRKHSGRISGILAARKKEMIVYTAFFILFLLLLFYAFVYLKINFSFFSGYLFSFIGMFWFFKTTHAISTFIVLSKETENISISDSAKSFYKMLKKIQLIDFLANLVFFYILAALLIIVLSKEMKALNNLNLTVPILFVILVLLLIPWFLKNLHKKRYERFYSKLRKSMGDVVCNI